MAEEEAKVKKRRSTANPTRARRAGGKPNTKAKTLPEKSALDEVYEALDVNGPDDEEVDGIEKLGASVNRVIAKRSVELAKKLAQQAEEGSLSSAKLIVTLGSKKQKAKKLAATALLDAMSTLECEQELVAGGSKSDPN